MAQFLRIYALFFSQKAQCVFKIDRHENELVARHPFSQNLGHVIIVGIFFLAENKAQSDDFYSVEMLTRHGLV